MASIFFDSVHVNLPTRQLAAPRYVVIPTSGNWAAFPRAFRQPPMKSRSLAQQIKLAATHPREFERAMDRALLINLHFLRQGPFRTTLCPSVKNPDLCLKGRFCPHAGSLAEFYANNVHLNPNFKTQPCEYRDRCQRKAECGFGHPGDLMRRIERTAGRRPYVCWYVLGGS